jgi:hypothetical protein
MQPRCVAVPQAELSHVEPGWVDGKPDDHQVVLCVYVATLFGKAPTALALSEADARRMAAELKSALDWIADRKTRN